MMIHNEMALKKSTVKIGETMLQRRVIVSIT